MRLAVSQHFGYQECKLKGLSVVQAWIARRLITISQISFRDLIASANALCDIISG
jgi:hypothetical protein